MPVVLATDLVQPLNETEGNADVWTAKRIFVVAMDHFVVLVDGAQIRMMQNDVVHGPDYHAHDLGYGYILNEVVEGQVHLPCVEVTVLDNVVADECLDNA